MTEAPIYIPPELIDSVSGFPILPPPGDTGAERGRVTEERIAQVLESLPTVQRVERHKKDGEQDGQGHDLTVYFLDKLGIEPINVQGKSRQKNLLAYRNKISRKLRRLGIDLTAEEWLIMDRTVPINGDRPEEHIALTFTAGVTAITEQGPRLNAIHQFIPLFNKAA